MAKQDVPPDAPLDDRSVSAFARTLYRELRQQGFTVSRCIVLARELITLVLEESQGAGDRSTVVHSQGSKRPRT